MRTIIPKGAILVPEQGVCVFKGEIFDTYQWEEKMFDGSAAIFEMLKRPDTVEVLVVHENKLLVQKQEQPFLGSFYSFPGGRHDHPEENEQEGCERELREETGYNCGTWKLLSARQSHPKIEAFAYTFLATDIVGQVSQSLDPGEKIENMWLSLPETRNLIQASVFRSGAFPLLGDAQEADDLLQLPEYTI